MSSLLAPEAQALLHQFSPFFIGHHLVDPSDDVDIHSVVVFFHSEVPSGFQFFFLWYVSPKNPLYLMVIVVHFMGFFVPFGEGLRYVVLVQDFFEEGNPDGFLEIINGSREIFCYS